MFTGQNPGTKLNIVCVSLFLQSHLQFWFEYNNVLRAKSTDKIVYFDFVNCFSNFDFGRHG